MRNFNCCVSCYVDNKLVLSGSTACWSMLNIPNYFHPKLVKETYKSFFAGREIYIPEFDDNLTKQYQVRLIWVINRITPCEVVTVNKRYIKFKCLATYDQSLILLNFIRNLWHEPITGYSIQFFKKLKESRDQHKDPVSRLTWANKEACESLKVKLSPYYNGAYSPGHSNFHSKGLRVKTTEELLKYVGNSTSAFLRST